MNKNEIARELILLGGGIPPDNDFMDFFNSITNGYEPNRTKPNRTEKTNPRSDTGDEERKES